MKLLLIILAVIFVAAIIVLVLKDKLAKTINTMEINAFKPAKDIKKERKL